MPAHASSPRTRQPRGPHPSAPRPNSSLPSERNPPLLQSGWAERRRLDLPAGWICLDFSPLEPVHLQPFSGRLVCWGHRESLVCAGSALPLSHLCHTSVLQESTADTLPDGDTLPSLPELLLPLRLPGAGESGRAGTACPAGAASSPGSLARSSQPTEPLGPCSPLCALGTSPCRALLCCSGSL